MRTKKWCAVPSLAYDTQPIWMEGESSLKIYTPDLFSCLLKVCQNEKEGDIAAKETFKP